MSWVFWWILVLPASRWEQLHSQMWHLQVRFGQPGQLSWSYIMLHEQVETIMRSLCLWKSFLLSYLMVVVEESRPTAILCSPSLSCWDQYGCSHATQDTWPAYTMGMIQFSILNSLTKTNKITWSDWSNMVSISVHTHTVTNSQLKVWFTRYILFQKWLPK